MAEIEYDDFLQNKLETITYNSELLTVQKMDKKVAIISRNDCIYSYYYRFTLNSTNGKSVEEAVKTAVNLKRVFHNVKAIIVNTKSIATDNRYVEVTPRLAKIEYCFVNPYYTEELSVTSVPREPIKFGYATLKWYRPDDCFEFSNHENIEILDELRDGSADTTYRQLYCSTLAKWVHDLYYKMYY